MMKRAKRKSVADAVIVGFGERENVRDFDGGFSVQSDNSQTTGGAGVIVKSDDCAAKSNVSFRRVGDGF